MSMRLLGWFKSLHAKLFIVTALVTSFVTILVAASITNNSRKEMLEYTKKMAVQTGLTVESEIHQRWDKDFQEFRQPRSLEEFLETLAGEDRVIFQIDVFKRIAEDRVSLVTSSIDDDQVESGANLGSYLRLKGPQPELVDLNTGNKAWKVYLPIRNPRGGGKPYLGIIRVYCDLEHWEAIWSRNLHRTYKILPLVLLGEFILLWVVLGTVVTDPVRAITNAMTRMRQGDPSARAEIRRADELGQIAESFNSMAKALQEAALEKEFLIEEIRGFNTHLQDRIDIALAELQAKNQELEHLMERNSLLREELGQQERLAVAGQLTTAFAHEVGTPLNLVNGHLQLLHSQVDLSEKTRERLGVIQSQIERVGDIVRRLLGLVRRPQLHQEAIPLETLLAELHRLWAPTFAAHHITLETEIPETCVLWVDQKQMEQLFINIVNNAMDAMPDGGLIKATATRPMEGSLWQVMVEDTGTGIPEELLPMVFRPMFTTKPEGKGTGLGLSICREIIRAHGGDIHIESREGSGSRILFTLPGVPRLA